MDRTNHIWPVPYFIDPQHLAVDHVVSFVVAVLLTLTINAEAQNVAATFLGDARPDTKDRFQFNCFLHLDALGTICYLVAGFGWPKQPPFDADRFKHPRLYTVVARMAGPVANLLLASIAGSLASIMRTVEYSAHVFLMLMGVSITTAIYQLLPLPPLAAGVALQELLPRQLTKLRWVLRQAGPFAIVALMLWDRTLGHGAISAWFHPMIIAFYNWLLG